MNFPACYPLAPTRSYPRPGQRRLHWFGGSAGFENLGTLTIVQGRSDVETYEIEADVDPFAPDARAWLLNRTTGEISENRLGTYRVECSPGGRWSCNCTGAATRRNAIECKHVQSVRVLDAEGELSGGFAEVGGESGSWFEDEAGEPTEYELKATVVR